MAAPRTERSGVSPAEARALLARRPRSRFSAAVPTPYRARLYRSKAEAEYARKLDLRVAAGEILGWQPAPRFDLIVQGQKVGRYTPDFLVHHLDGTDELVEIKGRAARDFQLRLKVFRACYPGWRVSVIDDRGEPWQPRRRNRQIAGAR